LASTTLRSNLPTEPAPEPRAPAANTAPATVPWMAGFFLCGCLLGMLGSLVVAWRYYIDVDSRLIGLHFLVFDAGMLAVHFAIRRRTILASGRFLALIASAVGVAGLVGLSFVRLARQSRQVGTGAEQSESPRNPMAFDAALG